MPELHFKGKEYVYNHHLTVPYRPLVAHPDKSIGKELENLIIQGDNLHALKALLPHYAGKVDCIFIDPPYNTGNENWNYNDNVNSPMIKDWLDGNPVNKDDMLRHDKWCCLMYPRLKLLRELLSTTGIILITIDDNEAYHLRIMLDEIFGENNFVGVLVWQKSKKGDAKLIANIHEYVFVAANNIQLLKEKGAWRLEKEGVGDVLAQYDLLRRKYKKNLSFDHDAISKGMRDWFNSLNKDNPCRSHKHYNQSDDRGLYFPADFAGPDDGRKSRPRYKIPHPVTGKACRIPSTGWRWKEEKTEKALLPNPPWIHFGPDETTIPCRKSYLKFVDKEPFMSVFYRDGRAGTLELEKIIGSGLMEFPKSPDVLEKLINLTSESDSLILDSFAGSATTAQAVLSLNSKDGGNRHFILVECEDYADKLTAERVRRVIKGYKYQGTQKEELLREKITWSKFNKNKQHNKIMDQVEAIENLETSRFDAIKKTIKDGELIVTGERKVTTKTEGLGGGFTYYTLGDPLDLDKMLTGKSLPDYASIGAWLFHTATGEPLDPKSIKEKQWYLGSSSAFHVWLVYKPDLDFLKSRNAALTLSLAEKIAKKKGKRNLVFAPSRFVPNKMLFPLRIEYAPLPFALYRFEKDQGMELKDFQQGVLNTFDEYLSILVEQRVRTMELKDLSREKPELNIPVPDYAEETWNTLKALGKLPKVRANVPYSLRKDGIARSVPSVTLKIPTGGGKTLLAASAISRIMSKWVQRNYGFVLWIVPNESIYTQTYKALNNREHPYRQILDRTSAGKVKILEKMTPLDRRDVDSHLCVMLLMLQSANRETKESLKMFKVRGNMHGFFPLDDDFQAHSDVLDQTPNLDVYGDKETFGCVIKDSLGNALRVTRPVVVMDEGHKAYSRLALDTLYGFNPSFVLELSATPTDRDRDDPPIYSNWLVDVRGTALDKEEMIKLPINVTVRGDDDWRDCLRTSYEHLNVLQAEADKLQAEFSRYIRPICLVQVERTGNDQRDGGFIHAEDAREYLLTLGVSEQQIAIKTSEKNDLKEPENLDLLSQTNQVRFIITKQALQEGWDCPFAYVLCSLAPVANKNALTQLIGRILRQPETVKTGIAALDECYVFCFHAATRDVVDLIKKGLEQDGMSDLADRITSDESGTKSGDGPRPLKRRKSFHSLKIYLPMVNWVDKQSVRPLDYEQDILYRIDWDQVNLTGLAKQIPKTTQGHETQVVQVGLSADPDVKDFTKTKELGRSKIQEYFDPLYVVRSISDIVPNPWVARGYVEMVVKQLSRRGIKGVRLGAVGHLVLETLRVHLSKKRDRLAEEIFMADVAAGRIQFRLRTDSHNWVMPDEMMTERGVNSQELRRNDGQFVEKNLFEATYKDDLNSYEQSVACYLDGEEALRWWHRNVAQRQYALQGWRKNKIYPDFIFAMDHKGNEERIMILETKGEHLDNPDTEYKQKVLDVCANAFKFENVTKRGDLELVFDQDTTVNCALIFEGKWETDLSKVLFE